MSTFRIHMNKLIVTLLLILTAHPASALSMQLIDNCNVPVINASRYTVLDNDRNTLAGWSHIKKTNDNGEYLLLTLNDDDYQISHDNHQGEPGCNGKKVQNAILVKKLSDWTRQHSNGIESILDEPDITFGELTHVMMDVRINSKDTRIVEMKTLMDRYKSYLTPEQFSEFDQGKVNLSITLFSEGGLDQSTESFNLEYFVEIDQALYFDQWLRVIIPLSEFNAYTEKDYKATERWLSDFQKTEVNGFRLNPENSHGKQLRHFLGDDWSKDIPETFKEMSISLRRIELLSID